MNEGAVPAFHDGADTIQIDGDSGEPDVIADGAPEGDEPDGNVTPDADDVAADESADADGNANGKGAGRWKGRGKGSHMAAAAANAKATVKGKAKSKAAAKAKTAGDNPAPKRVVRAKAKAKAEAAPATDEPAEVDAEPMPKARAKRQAKAKSKAQASAPDGGVGAEPTPKAKAKAKANASAPAVVEPDESAGAAATPKAKRSPTRLRAPQFFGVPTPKARAASSGASVAETDDERAVVAAASQSAVATAQSLVGGVLAKTEAAYCYWCGQHCKEVRLTSKSKNKWKCRKCAYVDTCLHRKFGTIAFTSTWAKEEKTSFYRDCRDSSAGDITLKAETVAKRYKIAESYFEGKGEFLPLSVWAAKGYDAAMIAANSALEDQHDDPVVGRVYRLRVISTGDRQTEGEQNTHMMMASSRNKRKRGVKDAADDANAVADEKSEWSDDDSSSTSSSSSHKKKKSKKGKKNKKAWF